MAIFPASPKRLPAVGERISSAVLRSSAVSATTGVVKNITSITLTPGDWDISAFAQLHGAAANATYAAWVSTTSATDPGNSASGDTKAEQCAVAGTHVSVTIPIIRASITVNTTYYLSSLCTVTGTLTVSGRITARRIR